MKNSVKKFFAAAALLALLTFAASFALAAGEVPVPIRVMLDEVEYTLPCSIMDFVQNGWKCNLSTNVEALDEMLVSIHKDNSQLFVTVRNEHYTQQNIKDCLLTVISVGSYMPPDEFLWEGVGFGTPYQQFLDKLPEGVKIETDNSITYSRTLSPEINYKYYISGDIDEEGKLDFLYIKADRPMPSAEILAERDAIPRYRPASFSQYIAPTSLGDDPLSGVFELEGKLYRLPLPLEQMADNGWIFSEDDWIPSGERKTIYIENNEGYFVNVYAQNTMEARVSSEEMPSVPAPAIYCVAREVSDPDGKAIKLPGDIHAGMREEDILPVLQPYAQVEKNEYIWDDSYDWTYVAERDEQRIEVVLYVKNGEVISITIRYNDGTY